MNQTFVDILQVVGVVVGIVIMLGLVYWAYGIVFKRELDSVWSEGRE